MMDKHGLSQTCTDIVVRARLCLSVLLCHHLVVP